MLVRVPEGVELLERVGLGAEVRHPATTKAALWTRGALRPLPTGTVMGVPADLDALAASGVLSATGWHGVPQDADAAPHPDRR